MNEINEIFCTLSKNYLSIKEEELNSLNQKLIKILKKENINNYKRIMLVRGLADFNHYKIRLTNIITGYKETFSIILINDEFVEPNKIILKIEIK